MKTPDITPAQLVAIVSSVLALGVSFGLALDAAQQAEVLGLVTVVASVLLHADAKIRNGRASVVAAETASAAPAPLAGQNPVTTATPPAS